MELERKILSIIESDHPKHDKLASILQLIINFCKINKKSYFILGSYALREYRTISDLDVNMDFDQFKKLKRLPFGEIQPYNNQTRWFYDLTSEYQKIDASAIDFSIEIFQKKPTEGFPNEKFSLGYLKEHDGLDIDKYKHQFFNLKTLLAWKTAMGRDKDKLDIELIKKILNQTGGTDYYKYVKYKNKYAELKIRN